MLSELQQAFSAFHGNQPFLFYALLTVTLFSSLFLAIPEYFKPVGKRRCKDGKLPILPPGPAGLPVLGSLLDLKEGRHDPDFIFVRTSSTCTSQ